MRDIKTLLQVLLNYLKENKSYKESGICSTINMARSYGMISKSESIILQTYINENRPLTFRRLFNPEGYWWPEMYKAPIYKEERVAYLEKLIKKLK